VYSCCGLGVGVVVGADVGFTVGVAAAAGTLVLLEAEATALPFGNGNEPGTAAAAMFAIDHPR